MVGGVYKSLFLKILFIYIIALTLTYIKKVEKYQDQLDGRTWILFLNYFVLKVAN